MFWALFYITVHRKKKNWKTATDDKTQVYAHRKLLFGICVLVNVDYS